MRSYSSAVTMKCATAFAPKKIQAAVQKVVDKEERSKNIIIYGLSETQNEQLQSKVEAVLVEIDEKPLIKDCCRIGDTKDKAIRPVKFSLSCSDHVMQILRNVKKLRTKEGFKSVYICPDRSVAERKAYKKLYDELKQKRLSESDKVHAIKNNKIVSTIRNSTPT